MYISEKAEILDLVGEKPIYNLVRSEILENPRAKKCLPMRPCDVTIRESWKCKTKWRRRRLQIQEQN